MKFFILLLAAVAIVHAEFTDDEEQQWLEFKMKHGRMFLSPGKELKRKKTFLKNAKDVEEHNKAFANGEVSYEKQTHMYSDLTEEAFAETFTGVNLPPEVRGKKKGGEAFTQSYPATLDLRTTAGVGPIRSQGGCGSCWAFSTCAAIEYGYWRKTGVAGDVSEQQLVDCVYGSYGGCKGGWMPLAMKYVSQNGGLAWESQYPYVAQNGTCRADSISPRVVNINSSNFQVHVASDDDSIKSALANVGVLSICVDCSDWGSYKSGIFVSPSPLGTFAGNASCLHAAALVGYGVDANSSTPYWIIRNSWNTWWGEKGYIRVDARRDSLGNTVGGAFLKQAFYPVMA